MSRQPSKKTQDIIEFELKDNFTNLLISLDSYDPIKSIFINI